MGVILNKRRAVALLLSALSASVMFASASCSRGGASAAKTSTETSEMNTTVQTTADPMGTLPGFDGKGYEFKILGYGGSTSTYREAEYFNAAELNGDVINDALYYRNAVVEEKYNIKISYNKDFKEQDARVTMINLALAGDNTYDLFAHKSVNIGAMLTAGVIAPWDDVPYINIDQPWYTRDAIDTYTVGFKHYALFGDMLATNITACWAFLFNKQLITDWSLEEPYDIVKSGGWTIDYLSKITKDVSRDLDGDGKYTESDFYGIAADKFATIDAWQVSFDIYAISKDKNDLPVLSFFSDRLVTAFEKIYSLYYENKGTLVHSQAYGGLNVFKEDRAVFFPIFIDYMLSEELRGMESDYGIVPYPKLDETQENYSTYVLPRFGAIMLPITANESNYKMVGAVVEAINAASYVYVRPAIYETALKIKTVRDAESVEMLDFILKNRHYDFSTAFEFGTTFPLVPARSFREQLSTGKSVNAATYYATVEAQSQAFIDDLVKKLTPQ